MVAQASRAINAFRKTRTVFIVGTVASVFAACAPASASDVDTEHLFGFTEGADIGAKGEREVESETIARTGKSAGSYAALVQNYEAKFVPVENLRLGARAALTYFDISGVPGLEDRRQAALQGMSFEARYMLVERHRGPFGLTLIAEPRWGRIDDISGGPVTTFGGMLTMALDKELITNRLFGAFNVLYGSDATHFRAPDIWQYESKIGFSGALALRVQPAFFAGGEIRYLRAYDGLTLGAFSGQAVFAGPTMYLQLSKRLAVSAAWNRQIYGRPGTGGGSLDLTHFERQQGKLRLNLNF